MEAIKLLAGFGEPLADRLLTFDLRSMTFRHYRLRRVENCPDCGPLASQDRPSDSPQHP
jgi:bacteriocin biosynthesis cyclodehydratase domain-containing protein